MFKENKEIKLYNRSNKQFWWGLHTLIKLLDTNVSLQATTPQHCYSSGRGADIGMEILLFLIFSKDIPHNHIGIGRHTNFGLYKTMYLMIISG